MARIAFLIPDMGGGGAERVALSLLRGFVERGHEVDLVLMQARGEFLTMVPPEVRIVQLAATRLRNAFWPLVRYLRRERPDAMQVSMWPLTVIGILAARLSRSATRVVTSDHSTLSRQYAKRPRTLPFLKSTIRFVYPLAAARIAVSKGVAGDLAHLSHLAPDQFEVVFNPVPKPPTDLSADREVEPVWQRARHRILTVGKLKPEKNVALLLEAVSQLDRSLDWRLVIVGEGPLRGDLEKRAAALGIADRVALPGFTSDPSPYYRTATLFVLSSDFEGLPTVLVEALHAGLQIVSTDCNSGPREILADGAYGTLVACGNGAGLCDAISAGLKAPQDPDRQKAAGRLISGPQSTDTYLRLMGVD